MLKLLQTTTLTNKLKKIMENLFNLFGDSMNWLYSEPRELAAIWVEKHIITGQGRTCRIAPDATIAVKDGAIIDVTSDSPATHKVILCHGTLVNQFEITAVSLTDGQPTIIKL